MFKNIEKELLFFQNKDPVFIANVVTKLKPLDTYPGQFIYKIGEYSHSSFSLQIFSNF